ncbi:hypothetical protein [Streptomyces sp. VRA16 Mangrove soil]|uniref:hypothetical protein n=1 Tax=Streptomyces sp. VRA16 Mangrove soil TaxID=2817434 RepID=UPI001A9D0DD7|nr:hypothetical protein [Streptomyces sp. VRA16 Mangrove soil]MBO1330734.1 hypothetical protein [Streptomyces sp. VRA16 Mangrove soil]
MTNREAPHSLTRRTALRTLAAGAVAVPLAVGPLGSAFTASAATLAWYPDEVADGLNAFEGLEADRVGAHPERTYALVENSDHYRLNIWADDLDSTGGGDRQRTEVKGMVQDGTAIEMHDGETWRIAYEMWIPTSLHGTSHFTHIFQTKTPATNDGPWLTVDLTRDSDGTERLRARAYANSGSPTIASCALAPIRGHWTTASWQITPGQSGAASFTLLDGTGDGAPVAAQGSMTGVINPDEGDYVRPKWGIYRSILSDPADIIDTKILFRNMTATRL